MLTKQKQKQKQEEEEGAGRTAAASFACFAASAAKRALIAFETARPPLPLPVVCIMMMMMMMMMVQPRRDSSVSTDREAVIMDQQMHGGGEQRGEGQPSQHARTSSSVVSTTSRCSKFHPPPWREPSFLTPADTTTNCRCSCR